MSTDSSNEPPDPLLRPDTFWELIEKLLLHKARDEKSRERHNAALSALCRGHALPRLPRDQKPNKPNKVVSKTKLQGNVATPNSIKEKLRVSKIKFEIFPGKVEDSVRQEKENLRSMSVNDVQMLSNAKEAKSECQLNDHDIVYIKDTAVPASEKLWRYAIKNRKRAEYEVWDRSEEIKPIPNIRSNEAIYLALKKRVDDREQQRRRERAKDSTIKQRHSCEHLQKIRSEKLVNKASNAIPKVKRTQSFQSQRQKQVNLHKKFIKPAMSVTTMHQITPKKAARIPQAPSREDMFSPWGHHDALSDLTKLVTVKCKEKFESKRVLYNSVIKRRLNCGSQLETFNKEMINKKSCTRTVLGNETRRKYSELKSEYLNLCYQESTLRHQIALLHADIYKMQNKGYHKTPASVKTITLNPRTAPLHRSRSHIEGHVTDDGAPPMFPCLKAPRPLITSQQRLHFEKQPDKTDKRRPSAVQSERKTEVRDADTNVKYALPKISDGGNPSHGVCSIYSINPRIVTQQRQPFTLPERKVDKLIHRLPRMASDTDTGSEHNVHRIPVNVNTRSAHSIDRMAVNVDTNNTHDVDFS